jgi:predicted metal-dependent hydrolase
MRDNIEINGKKIEYNLVIRRNAKQIRLLLHKNGDITVSSFRKLPKIFIKSFLKKNFQNIEKYLNLNNVDNLNKKESREEYLENKENARGIVEKKLLKYNSYYNFKYNRVSIRDQKTRWGSCSSQGNLNFNYRIYKLPEELANYVIVHELCHLKEFNHSRSFWDLIFLTIPDYKERRKKLKNNHKLI